jgi:hypothetical protein
MAEGPTAHTDSIGPESSNLEQHPQLAILQADAVAMKQVSKQCCCCCCCCWPVAAERA